MKKPVRTPKRKIQTPKECYFCKENKTPHYADTVILQKFVSERGKIVGKVRNGLCAMHQRRLTLAIKYARHLALLPFIERG